MNAKIYIEDYNCITPIGTDIASNWKSLLDNKSEIKTHQILDNHPGCYASIVDNDIINTEFSKITDRTDFTRFEKLLIIAINPIIKSKSVAENSLLVLSTTKGNISEISQKSELPESAHLYFSAQKIADFFNFKTKPIIVSNACVSGVMAVSIAKTLIETDKYDDAYIIAGDELTPFVVSGFNSFQALSEKPCKPYDSQRNGISIGEAAAAIYISRKESTFEILGSSSINDANHISGPSRTGEGLVRSIQKAIEESDIQPSVIDYISAHGTATIYNDEMEAIAFNRLNLQNTPVNSLKGYYGHCLGASGLLEIIVGLECSKNSVLLPTKNFENIGVSQLINVIAEKKNAEIKLFLKTASGFGGSNSAIIIKRTN